MFTRNRRSALSDSERAVYLGLVGSALLGCVGVWHFDATTNASKSERPVVWYAAAWLAYFTTPALALTLLLRYRIASPTIPVAYLAYDLLTGPFTGKGVDGHYPGLIIVGWPFMVVSMIALAGTEYLVRTLVCGESTSAV